MTGVFLFHGKTAEEKNVENVRCDVLSTPHFPFLERDGSAF